MDEKNRIALATDVSEPDISAHSSRTSLKKNRAIDRIDERNRGISLASDVSEPDISAHSSHRARRSAMDPIDEKQNFISLTTDVAEPDISAHSSHRRGVVPNTEIMFPSPGAYAWTTMENDEIIEIQRRSLSLQMEDSEEDLERKHSINRDFVVLAAHVVPEDDDLESRLRAEFEEKFQSIAQSAQQLSSVVSAEIVQAEPIPRLSTSLEAAPPRPSRRKRNACIMLSGFLFLLVGAAVGTVFGLDFFSSDSLAPQSFGVIPLEPTESPVHSGQPTVASLAPIESSTSDPSPNNHVTNVPFSTESPVFNSSSPTNMPANPVPVPNPSESFPPTETPIPNAEPISNPTSSKPVSALTPSDSLPPLETPAPNADPTLNPTGEASPRPTKPPTGAPTRRPTQAPTSKPTTAPTRRPAQSPTRHPTQVPTSKPTTPPTRRPTSQPQNPEPTNSPTTKPKTATPTDKTTPRPTSVPTIKSPTVALGSSDLRDILFPVSGSSLDDAKSDRSRAFEYLAESNYIDFAQSSGRQVIELYVVILFWYATQGNNNSWDDDCNFFSSAKLCDWNDYGRHGVFCNDDGHVSELNIHENNVQGSLVSELSELSALEYLNLHDNALSGSIPPQLGDLQNLIELELDENRLTGTIPSQVTSLPKLEYLGLSDNAGLRGNVNDLFSYLSSGMAEFDCKYDSLFDECWVWLLVLLIRVCYAHIGSQCDLSGSLESINWSRFDSFRYLRLQETGLEGRIPNTLGLISTLSYVALSDNELTGIIPASFSSLPSLQVLELRSNQLRGSVPQQFSSNSLAYLDISENQLTGNLASIIGGLPSSSLQSFNARNNEITGSIPNEIGQYASLLYFSIGNNDLFGTLPNELGQLTNLALFGAEGNNLQGTIPDALAGLPDLWMLRLYDNDLMDNLNDVFCPTRISDFIVDCAFPEWVTCDCCTACFSHDFGGVV
jgi:Leucine-rich repeat (LRR) protein